MRTLASLLFVFACSLTFAQNIALINELELPKDFENVFVKQVSSDSLQTRFIIWVKAGVKNHFHAKHTENIYVLSGKTEMSMGDETFIVQEGDYITIPMGVHHSVTKVFGKKRV